MTTSAPPVAFIGLGIMGRPMAGHLLRAGHPLFIHSRTRFKGDDLVRAGARWCASPADAARHATLVLTNVTDTPDVEQVVLGPGGVAETAASGSTVIDLSTISPEAARRMAETLSARGVAFLDAPVTGGEVGAVNGTLTIMVGGDAGAFERVRPVLEKMGKRIVHVGPSGSGQALKACNQVLCAMNMIGVCEALLLARRSGLDTAQLVDTLQYGAGGSWALTTLGGKINAGDLEPAFMISLMQKDLRIVQEAASRAALPLPGTALAQQLFRAVEGLPGGARLGTQAMIRAYEKLGGS